MNINLYKPKLLHTAFVQLSGFLAMWFDKLSGIEYASLTGAALLVYTGANVMEQKIQSKEKMKMGELDPDYDPVQDKPTEDG